MQNSLSDWREKSLAPNLEFYFIVIEKNDGKWTQEIFTNLQKEQKPTDFIEIPPITKCI